MLDELWQAALGEIELNISKANFITWFKNTRIIKKEDGIITIGVPSSFSKEWLENKYYKFILKALRNISPEIKEVNFLISPNSVSDIKPINKKTRIKED